MKIEVGKTYKNRVGGVVTITQFDKSNDGWPLVGSDHLTYNVDGAWRNLNYSDKEDLVEECNADGSPIEANRCLQVEIGDAVQRVEIAYGVLTAMIASPPVCNRADVDKAKWCRIAFEWADEFIKVAKQS